MDEVVSALRNAPVKLFAPAFDVNQLYRMIPVVLILLVVGIFVFDAASLSRLKLRPTQLGEIYGLRTSLGYASLIGSVAALDPILKFVGSLFPTN